MKDSCFIKVMPVSESKAGKSFMLIVENFLNNHKEVSYEEIVRNMLTNFQMPVAYMSTRLSPLLCGYIFR